MAPGTFIGGGVSIRTYDGGRVDIGSNVTIGAGVEIRAGGGVIRIGDNVYIGQGSVIVAKEQVTIGMDTMVAEYVTIRDQDHDYRGRRPVRSSGFLVAPVAIGEDVWIGAKASILKGAQLGSGCVVAAHAVVRSSVPSGAVVGGVPARVIRAQDA
jgi:acetyltransferase-like isoleucine patch superfamily enzyme